MRNSMYEAFAGDGTDAPSLGSLRFKESLGRFAKEAADKFINSGVDLDESISKIAQANNLNEEQIKRIVEETNNQVFLSKYAQTSNATDREILFKLANTENIVSRCEEISKTASVQGDKLDAFNFSSYRVGALTPAKDIDIVKLAMEKLAGELDITATNLNAAKSKFDAQIYKIAELLIRYDRSGADTQDIYNVMCKDAYIRVPMQEFIKVAVNELIDQEKLANTCHSDYSLDLEYTDLASFQGDFSLGKHTFMKEAKELPVMQSNGTVIRNISDMVKLASDIHVLYEDTQKCETLWKEAHEKTDFKKIAESR